MRCPVCSTKLVEVKAKTALVDVCPSCKGIWFDSGEFVDFVRSLTESEEISPRTPQLFKEQTAQSEGPGKKEESICPRCHQRLQEFNYAYDSNVFLDKCPQCQGMWADGGEVREVARCLKEDPKLTAIGAGLVQRHQTLQDLVELGEGLTAPVSPFVLFMPKIVLPLSDENPRQRTPVVTLAVITLCVVTFIGQVLLITNPGSFLQKFGFIPVNFFTFGIITSMFLHGGWLHLTGNMFFLWLFGDNVEDQFSRHGFLLLYLCCGLVSSVLHGVLNLNSSIPAIGASGAISGVMGAYCVFYPTAKIKLFFISRIVRAPAFLYFGSWFLLQFMFGLISQLADVTGIAWSAHVGGFVFGALVAFYRKSHLRRIPVISV